MYSKTWIKILIGATTLSGLIACSDFLKGKKQEKEVIEFSDEKFSCLQQIPDGLKKMTTGVATETEIRGNFDCAQQALQYFEKRTQGSYEDGYSADDIRKFFGKYFLKDNNISPATAQELLKLKKALFGGSKDWISKSEIKRLSDFLSPAKEEVVLLSKHMGILLLKTSPQAVPWPGVVLAVDQLRSCLQNLLGNTDLAKSDYSFDDLKNLLNGMSSFVSGGQDFAPYNKLGKWIPLVDGIKRVLIGAHAQLGGANDWTLALNNLVDLYAVFLRFHYVVADHAVDNKAALQEVTNFILDGYNLMYGSFQMVKVGEIPFDDIDNLIDQALAVFSPPFGLDAPAIKQSYRVFVLKMLEPYRNGDSRGLSALTRAHFLSVKREVNVWRLSQIFIDGLDYDSQGQMKQTLMVEAYNKFNADEAILKQLQETDSLEQDALKKSWGDLGLLLTSTMPVVFNGQGRFVVTPQQKVVPQTWKSLMKLNIIKAFDRIVLLGYGDQGASDLANSALSEKSLVQAYDDFKLAGLAIKAFDPRNANTGARSFKEANFFTFSGNGDARMDFKESFEFFSILISAGLGTSSDISKSMEGLGCTDPSKKDVFGYKLMIEACFKTQFRKNFRNYFNNLSRMSDLVEGMNDRDWNDFYSNLLTASRDSDPRGGFVETSDLRTLTVILHYVDDLLVIYDTDGNRMLSRTEIYGAAPRFYVYLRAMYPGNSDSHLADGLAFMLIYGRQPSDLEVAWFIAKYHLFEPPEASPLNIVKVIAVLKDQLK